jgi:3'-phosphoadenosine 5'-phosphosulfate sulfotransferase (PAPS reductase)/FAD synthetase
MSNVATQGTPDLQSYHVILVNTSAGKDSQAMLDYVVQLCDEQNIPRARVVAVHADLGRVEWAGTRALAERQVAHYGIRFEAVSRPQGDLLVQISQRGMWPSSTARYCTSDHKRGQIQVLMTKLAAEHRAAGYTTPCRILNCMGLRAQESPDRAKKQAFEPNVKATNGRRTVDNWLLIHAWTTEQVWDRIRQSGVEHHRAYDLGMKRLSCVFCVFASKSSLLIAGHHNPELLTEYVQLEKRMGHTFRKDFTIESIKTQLDAGLDIGTIHVTECESCHA